MAPTSTPPGEPQDDLETYVGLDAAQAEEQARERGWSTIRSVPPGAFITMEYLTGRVNFEVADGVVRRSWKG